VVPHDFSYSQPQGVDFSLMTIFVEFYTTVLGFVLFRLYHNLNLQYPPSLSGTIQDFSTENEPDAVDDEVQKERVAGKDITKFFTGLTTPAVDNLLCMKNAGKANSVQEPCIKCFGSHNKI
jgi:hypothetical protein